jgi:hypothetical protein
MAEIETAFFQKFQFDFGFVLLVDPDCIPVTSSNLGGGGGGGVGGAKNHGCVYKFITGIFQVTRTQPGLGKQIELHWSKTFL